MALSDVAARNAKPGKKMYKLTDEYGLYLQVKALRISSSCSAVSSPRQLSAPQQSGQHGSAGSSRFSSRGSESGNGLRGAGLA